MTDDNRFLVLGIDPGLGGAHAALAIDGRALWAEPLPVLGGKRRELDVAALTRRITLDRDAICLAVLEEVGAASSIRGGRRVGANGIFGFGRTVGRIEGILAALRIPIERVTPQRWKKEILHDTDRSKEAAIAYASRRFPGIPLVPKGCRVPRDGLAEALCIAEVGRRLISGELPDLRKSALVMSVMKGITT